MALVSAPPEPPLTDQPKSAIRVTDSPSLQQQPQERSKHGLLSVGYNQDYGCFACGTETGFRIYNCEPFKETFRREFSHGGIAIVEMLFRCNILALVGGGANPKYLPNKVMIWDDHQSRCIGELSFRSDVRAIRLRRDRVVVVLEHKIYVYNFSDLKLLHQVETIGNPRGLCALSPASSNSVVLACPGLHKGQVRVEQYGLRKTKFISAHDSHLACLALTFDGRLLATASIKGTLIRVYNTLDGTQLQEVRRGADRADIYSIAFSTTAQWLVVSSDKGTIHVFSLKVPAEADAAESTTAVAAATANQDAGSPESPIKFASGNPGSTLSFMRGVLPKYFSSEWSFAQFRLPVESRSIVAFGPQKNTLLFLSLLIPPTLLLIVCFCDTASFYRCSFDPVNGGEMIQQEYAKFV
ncbi:hypothetical protein SELMODRAFT_177001 [Selaginella moellendorffii]|uniref:Autophagy-related protein 18a n=1 Tax=Selaginella moellendorffii TaxID=88036 RepID=D8S598_SELML|nr:hypothetical protein SELMODRAFT_177001 [Selaginella moellendorffii]